VGHSAWFEVQSSQFPRIEQMPNKQIMMYRPIAIPSGIPITSFSPTGSQSEAATIDQLVFTPPAGLEAAYFSLLITALSLGKKLIIEGHIAAGTSVIASGRVQME
jgi:hypothetical protein